MKSVVHRQSMLSRWGGGVQLCFGNKICFWPARIRTKYHIEVPFFRFTLRCIVGGVFVKRASNSSSHQFSVTLQLHTRLRQMFTSFQPGRSVPLGMHLTSLINNRVHLARRAVEQTKEGGEGGSAPRPERLYFVTNDIRYIEETPQSTLDCHVDISNKFVLLVPLSCFPALFCQVLCQPHYKSLRNEQGDKDCLFFEPGARPGCHGGGQLRG